MNIQTVNAIHTVLYNLYLFSNSKMSERLILTVENEVEIETQDDLREGMEDLQLQAAENGVGTLIGKNMIERKI